MQQTAGCKKVTACVKVKKIIIGVFIVSQYVFIIEKDSIMTDKTVSIRNYLPLIFAGSAFFFIYDFPGSVARRADAS